MDATIAKGPCWIFVAERELSTHEQEAVAKTLQDFIEEWSSHGADVHATYELRYDRLLIIKADERWTHVSGCSRDTLYRAMQAIGKALRTTFMDRMHLPVQIDGSVTWIHYHDLTTTHEAGMLADGAMVFDTSVDRVESLGDAWRPVERYLAT